METLDESSLPQGTHYWDTRYQDGSTGWDLGTVSPPLRMFIDTIENKALRILIPGCGNSYEADYLLSKGFESVTLIDIAPTPVETLQTKFKDKASIQILCADFFEHQGIYDLILEQTFFCALPPHLRAAYVKKMYSLLSEKGVLAGVWFDRLFEGGPPFGGTRAEYESLFMQDFIFQKIEPCTTSIIPRAGTEIWMELHKRTNVDGDR